MNLKNVVIGASLLFLLGGGLSCKGKKPETRISIPTPIEEIAPRISQRDSILTGGIYTVESGDNLWGISNKLYGYGALWPVLAEGNNIKIDFCPNGNFIPERLYPRDTLKVYKLELGKVKAGDSYWKLAKRCGITPSRFMDLNSSLLGEVPNPGEVYIRRIVSK